MLTRWLLQRRAQDAARGGDQRGSEPAAGALGEEGGGRAVLVSTESLHGAALARVPKLDLRTQTWPIAVLGYSVLTCVPSIIQMFEPWRVCDINNAMATPRSHGIVRASAAAARVQNITCLE